MYNMYLEKIHAMDIATASDILSSIARLVTKQNDEVLTELYQDFISACLRYAKIRAEWATLSTEEKVKQDEGRTLAHDRLIDCHNILYRHMVRLELDTKWYSTLGYTDMDKMTRKRLGDFACYVSLFLGLESR